MADHPFSNAGLGMFGTAEKQYAQAGMHATPKKDNILGGSIASFLKALGIGQSSTDQTSNTDESADVGKAPVLPPSSSYAPVVPYYGFGKPPSAIAPSQQMQTEQPNDQNFIDSFQLPRLK